MKMFVVAAWMAVLVLGLVGSGAAQVEKSPPSVPAQPEKPQATPPAPAAVPQQNAQQFIQSLVGQVGNQDPRVRFAVREGIVAMGAQSVPLLKAVKETQTSAHVKAFIDRTLKRIQSMAKREKKGFGSMVFSLGGGNGNRDIDRIAMELNLTWEQMDKLPAVFKKYDRDVKELMAAMREEGGFADSEAWKDLREEMKLMQEGARPALQEFLNESQSERAMRYLRRSSPLGGIPFSIGGGEGSIQIFEGPGGATGVTVRKVERVEKEE